MPALLSLQQQAVNAIQSTKVSKAALDNAINDRRNAFADLKSVSTKIINALTVSGTTSLAVDDAKTINRKIQGIRASKKTVTAPQVSAPAQHDASAAATPPADKSISVSQQSYDSQIDQFAKLIEVITQNTSYNPNEAELQVKSLSVKLANMKTCNTTFINRYIAGSNDRIVRDNVLYTPQNGLVPTALEIKKYIKSVFGATSQQYKQVNSVQFTRSRAA